MELERAEIERRAIALIYKQPDRIPELEPSWIEAEDLRRAVQYLRILHFDPDSNFDGESKVLDLLNTLANEHLNDDPEALTDYISELKKGKLPVPRFFNDLQEPDFVMPDVLIDGIVHKSGKVLFSAPSKARKTWALIYMLLCVQAGKDWWGFPTTRSKALLIDCELFQPAAYNRARKVAKAAGIWDTSGLAIQSLRGYRLSLDRIKRDTIDFCREHEIGLIGIDPYYRIAAGKDENSNNEIALFLEGIEEIAHETGAAIALTHHYAKGNAAAKNSIDRMSGAGTFARDPDALLSMTEADASDNNEPVFVIEPTIREFPPVEPFAIRWEYPLWIRDNSLGTSLKGSGEPGRPAESSIEKILELLPREGETGTKEWQRFCYDEGVSRATFHGLKAEALKQGRIVRRKDGKQVFWSHALKEAETGISGLVKPPKQEVLGV